MTILIVNKNELEIVAETEEDKAIVEGMRGQQLRAVAYIDPYEKTQKISIFSDN